MYNVEHVDGDIPSLSFETVTEYSVLSGLLYNDRVDCAGVCARCVNQWVNDLQCNSDNPIITNIFLWQRYDGDAFNAATTHDMISVPHETKLVIPHDRVDPVIDILEKNEVKCVNYVGIQRFTAFRAFGNSLQDAGTLSTILDTLSSEYCGDIKLLKRRFDPTDGGFTTWTFPPRSLALGSIDITYETGGLNWTKFIFLEFGINKYGFTRLVCIC